MCTNYHNRSFVAYHLLLIMKCACRDFVVAQTAQKSTDLAAAAAS